MNKTFPALAAAALLAIIPASHAADVKASRFYEDALTRFENRDVAGAIVQLKNALQIDKSMLPVHMLLGKALLAQGDAVGAEVELTEALRLGVNRAEVVVPLARALIAQGRQQDLLEQPRFAPAGLPQQVQARLLLLRASASADTGDSRAALRAIDDARALEPASPDPWMAEVPVRIRNRQFTEAAAAADKALQLAPRLAQALYLRGSVAHARSDLATASAYYDKAIAIAPTDTEALVARAGLRIDLGRWADARRDVDTLLASAADDPRGAYLKALLDDHDGNAPAAKAALANVTSLLDPVPMASLRYRPQALMLGGQAHYALGEREKAKPYLEAVQRTQPGSPVAKLLAQIYLAENETDRAIGTLESYLATQPGDGQATLLLASANFAKGRNARAAQLMQDALKTSDDPSMHTMLGLSLAGGGQFADAAQQLEDAFRKDPHQLQAGMALTTLYLQASQTARAADVATRLAQQFPGNAGVQNLLGAALARNGDAAAARTAFGKAAGIEPGFAAPQVNLARLDRQAHADDAAAARLDALLARDEGNVDALLEKGLVEEQRGRLADAQRAFEKADDRSGPADVAPAIALVDFLLRNGRADAAKQASRRLTLKAPEALPVLITLARVSIANADPDSARRSLAQAARQAGYNATALLQIALLQSRVGDLPGSAYSLDKALTARPDFLPAMALMAETELRQGNVAQAEARARQISSRFPRSGAGPALLGDIANARGQTAAALDAYRKAHAIEPTTASLMRIYRLQSGSDAAGAVRLAEQWLHAHPQDAAVRRALADGYARTGNLVGARAAYEAALKAAPDDADAMNNLANVLLLLNDPGAQAMAERAMKIRPGVPYIIGTAGWAAFKAGQTDRALELLRDARLRDPNNPDTRYFLGAVLASTGRKAEARDELEGALRSGLSQASARDAQKLLATLR